VGDILFSPPGVERGTSLGQSEGGERWGLSEKKKGREEMW